MPKKLIFLLFAMFLSACGEDTTGTGAATCGPDESLNPISGACEAISTGGPNSALPPNSTNAANSANGTPNSGDQTCEDCAVFFRPGTASFTYTPARESGSVDLELVSQVDSALRVTDLVWEGATPNEFFLLGLDIGDELSTQAARALTLQFSPQDLTDDDVTLRVYFDGLAEPAVLTLTSQLTGADVCTENCPRIQVDPGAVSISYQPGDPAIQRTVLVGSVGDANLELREVLLVQQGRAYTIQHTTLPLDLRPQETTNLDLTFDTSVAGAVDARLLIRSNDPWTPEVEVPITASSKDASTDPCINVAPTSLDFGSLQRGQQAVKHFTITNCGPVDLYVTDIQRGSFFGIQTSQAYQLTGWTNGMIASGASQDVELTYSPRRAGFDNGHFTVRSDATNSPAVRVNVRAISEAPPIADQDIHIEVEWDSDNTDVDTHVLLLPGTGLFCDNDCYFSNPEPDWGVQGDWQDDPFLDTDDVDGYGPENVNIKRGIDGMNYRVVLHYWRDSYEDSFSSDSDVTVKLYIRGVLQQTWGPINLGSTGDTKNVFEIAWPSQTITTFNDPLYSVPSSTSCRSTP